jgi:redox-sensitive bicupin YhaK (pirin superfamily)
MATRRIAKIFKSRPTVEGAGVHLKRAFGYSEVPQFDPFLMLDDFHTSNPDEYLAGFPWHPHRGIETITYVLEGLVEHGDSMGNKGAISVAYILAGEAYFDDQRDAYYACEMVGHGWSDTERCCVCAAETVVLFEHSGEEITITTTDTPVRFLFVAGKPLGEPVAWYGPVVMNTQEELKIAFEEYQRGTFVK